ncbi:hypothetical protein ASPBRDRAFT_223065 [Aspergillus brasiliensis CBS 101740]|uniref:Uncharacterized protein n=1 Tax=Aspergillus brasiliensis (strain CBS 101740 / IMI 381727 / IBT 21946) TaxID=767769 RepID=A0A1L9UZB6_ASPBC|nr:hypothetical protein ASPBRDRAFT_223065 [Aspergillus brasiliensis CBS 101740]
MMRGLGRFGLVQLMEHTCARWLAAASWSSPPPGVTRDVSPAMSRCHISTRRERTRKPPFGFILSSVVVLRGLTPAFCFRFYIGTPRKSPWGCGVRSPVIRFGEILHV